MKKIIITLLFSLGLFSFGYSQSSDEKIADAINNSDWFALDSLYQTEPRDSISDFFEIYSRCLIGNRLNRPDVSMRLRNYSTLSQKILILAICSIRL